MANLCMSAQVRIENSGPLKKKKRGRWPKEAICISLRYVLSLQCRNEEGPLVGPSLLLFNPFYNLRVYQNCPSKYAVNT